MNSSGAWIYLLYGDDEFSRDEALRNVKEQLRAQPAGEHNLTELSGEAATLRELRVVADAMPFLAEKRLVVVHGLVGRLQGKPAGGSRRKSRGGAKAAESSGAEEYGALIDYLPGVPPTTAIAFVEGKGIDPQPIAAAIPSGRAFVRSYQKPDRPQELPGWVATWVRRRARVVGAEFDESAVHELAATGDDLRRLDNEMRKLAAYCDGRPVTRADVVALVVGKEVTVWALLDALTERRRDRALVALRQLYEQGEKAEAILGRDIAPLYRRLVVAKEIAGLDRAERAAFDPTSVGLNPRTVSRQMDQAARFETAELERALELLLDLDRQIKTGETDPETAVEVAIVRLCSRLSNGLSAVGSAS